MREQIPQGIQHALDFKLSDLPTLPQGEEWKVALFNKATNKRYVADKESISGDAEYDTRFIWPAGVKHDANHNNIPDPDYPNGTAHMPIGTYSLQLFASNLSNFGEMVDYGDVTESNILASNSGEDYEAS